MDSTEYPLGEAVFLRTDTADYAEETIVFTSLEEMVKVCSEAHPNMILEKLVIYARPEGELVALTLGFVSSTKGQRPVVKELSTD